MTRDPDIPPTDLVGGFTIDHFRLIEKIGEGGMGEVYLADDTRLRRRVALKFLAQGLCAREEHRERFLHEARAAAQLDHRHIVTVHEVGAYQGRPYFSMAYVPGCTLDRYAARHRLPVERIVELGLQISAGLSAAHDRAIIHRDLKPSNIIIDEHGDARILDFGLAFTDTMSAVGDGDHTISASPAPVTFAGTLPYMAPEQLAGARVSAGVDLFALGVILYELLCGTHPFKAESPSETVARILRDQPAPPRAQRAEIPYDLERIVMRCLRKDPVRRFQTARDVHNELLDLHEVPESLQHLDHPIGVDSRPRLQERAFVLTAELVRQLSYQSPRMVGDRMVYLDNGVDSDVLVIYLHAWGLDHRHTSDFLSVLPHRGISPTLYGFDHDAPNRFPLTLADHSVLMRQLMTRLHEEIRPRHVVLTGFSSGADHALHMLSSHEGTGIPVSGLVPFGCNTGLASCFISSKFARLTADKPDGLLGEIKAIGDGTRTLSEWLTFHEYMVDVFSKFGADASPLRSFGRGIVEPFEKHDWRQFAAWYRTAIATVPIVRFVIDADDFDAVDRILEHHLRDNVLGDDFTEETIVREDVPHVELASPEILLRHTSEVTDLLA